jgi:hypothetical protein
LRSIVAESGELSTFFTGSTIHAYTARAKDTPSTGAPDTNEKPSPEQLRKINICTAVLGPKKDKVRYSKDKFQLSDNVFAVYTGVA